MTNAVLQAIADRRSNRGYAPRQLTEEELGRSSPPPCRRPAPATRSRGTSPCAERRAFEGVSPTTTTPCRRPTPAATSSFLKRPRWSSVPRPLRRRRSFRRSTAASPRRTWRGGAPMAWAASSSAGPWTCSRAQRGRTTNRPLASRRATLAIAVAPHELTLLKEAHVVREGRYSACVKSPTWNPWHGCKKKYLRAA